MYDSPPTTMKSNVSSIIDAPYKECYNLGLGKVLRWGNRDIYPVAHDKRVYGVYDFVAYWVSSAPSWFEWENLY